MRRFSFIFLLYGLVSGQVPNPCEDERFIKISEKFVDQMTNEEYKYFKWRQEKAKVFCERFPEGIKFEKSFLAVIFFYKISLRKSNVSTDPNLKLLMIGIWLVINLESSVKGPQTNASPAIIPSPWRKSSRLRILGLGTSK